MKFSDGFWQLRPGVQALYGRQTYDVQHEGDTLNIIVPTKVVETRGDTLNRPALSVVLHSPMPGVVGVRIEHHTGGDRKVAFDLPGTRDSSGAGHVQIAMDQDAARLVSGDVTATVSRGAPWSLVFTDTETGRVLTSSGDKSLGYLQVAANAPVDGAFVSGTDGSVGGAYLHEQLALGVGELVYGLGERFGPLVKNGQSIEVWNADAGTSSEQAYKNIPFYLTNRGYGVLVNHPGHVSFEVGSETVERVQFSVAGESLEYFVIGGGQPAGVLDRYTELTGRPARVPAWSYGLWLSTSFTTDYDEETVTGFIEGMAEREIPLSVFHFDCFWMREFNWCDFEWDPRVFPDPAGMLARLHERGLRVCVWINPYIAQRSPLFDEAKANGYLVRRTDGSVWQWDMWQAGMALVDFTNPAAVTWYQDHLRRLVAQGVDSFKTDFGERIPVDVDYFDGSDPERMHNLYTQRYNEAVFEVLEEARGAGEAVLFARSATTGGQRLPVHWGGDNTSTFESMAETLRGGLSLGLSGFGFWSHDIGGFEGMPDAGVFKRWVAFGLLSSHSRLHGSENYRVPWLFDAAEGRDEADPLSATSVLRRFTQLKLELMPYLFAAGEEAHRTGLPVMRPMQVAFPEDPATAYLERQYMLGPDLLVAPVMDPSGEVDFYLPAGRWTSLLTGETREGGAWVREHHEFDSLPLYARSGAVIATSPGADRADADWLSGVTLRIFPGPTTARRTVDVVSPDGQRETFEVTIEAGRVAVRGGQGTGTGFKVQLPGADPVAARHGEVEISR
ncbi:alpha-xylosidase [Zhihengliuella halotolerans]|uniref:alpha-D-xyloside xylohydrolase n=1 Tax=Zhihengliuella halotolerans TaxID=370736 RepID=A0A4Q8AGZ7_9MICC|nr:alpha-xylosidase [Zhihengliuella halotolerans]RZU63652.1 alpha-D-xyloside xylohydrolase [Zhihengliuella halotolerans]